jgi:peptide/nickel transport system substrate-binding protein
VKKWFIPLAILLIVAFMVSGCGTKTPAVTTSAPATAVKPTATNNATPTTKQPKYGGSLIMIDTAAPANSIGWMADPAVRMLNFWVNPMMEALLKCDLKGKFTPYLAESYEVAPDLKSITVKVRKGITFHDGSVLNGEAVKWNYDVLIAAKMGNLIDFLGVDLIDEYTVRFNLKNYSNTILSDLTTNWIVSKAAYDKAGGGKAGEDYLRWNPVGTGPFKFVEFKRDTYIKYVKFDNYWQKGKPYLNSLEIDFVTDSVTRTTAFLTGAVDIEGAVLGQQDADTVAKGYKVETGNDACTTLVPDSANPTSPFSKIEVRMAADYAINRDAIAKARGFGWWLPVSQWAIPGTYEWVNDLQPRAFNPTKAKELLTAAGYPNGFEMTIFSNADSDMLVALQGMLGDVGMKVKLEKTDMGSYTNYSTKGWTTGFLVAPNAYASNHNKGFSYNLSKSNINLKSLNKPDDIEQMYLAARAAREIDPALTQKWVKAIFDQCEVFPLFNTTRGDIMQKYVYGTNFFTEASFISWTPADTWMDK